MNICFIGSGNISTNLGIEFKRLKFNINRICSKNELTGKKLAKKLNATYSSVIDIPSNTDLVIIGVPDDQIKKVSKHIKTKAVIHTSGSKDINVLKDCSKNYGVVWPIQSFSKQKLNFKNIPICIEGNNKVFEKKLNKIFQKSSNSIFNLDYETRKIIHLSAVFSCNFLNYLLYISDDLLKTKKIDLSILNPIINETIRKAFKGNIMSNQTGPAVRKDFKTIEKHLAILSKNRKKKYIDVYNLITKNIISSNEN